MNEGQMLIRQQESRQKTWDMKSQREKRLKEGEEREKSRERETDGECPHRPYPVNIDKS